MLEGLLTYKEPEKHVSLEDAVMKRYVEQRACSVNVRGAQIRHAADKGAKNKKKLGFKESVSRLWQFSKSRYTENTRRSMKRKAVNAPTEGDESLGGGESLFGLGSSYSRANLQNS